MEKRLTSREQLYVKIAAAGLRRATEYKEMAEISKKAGNERMAEDLLDYALLEELRAEFLRDGVIVQMTTIKE